MSTSTSSSNPTKASFTSLDDTSKAFTVQFNPKELKFDKKGSWQDKEEQGGDSDVEFKKGNPATLSMELHFDTTLSMTGGTAQSVKDKWVLGLLQFQTIEVDGEGDTKRPHFVTFAWKDFSFVGFFESLMVTYTMFASDGTPVRAKITVKMKEKKLSTYTMGQQGDGVNATRHSLVGRGGRVSVVTTSAESTANQVAAENGVSTEQLLADNPQIEDPTAIPAGTELVIGTGASLLDGAVAAGTALSQGDTDAALDELSQIVSTVRSLV